MRRAIAAAILIATTAFLFQVPGSGFEVRLQLPASAGDASDRDLEAASTGRTVRLGALAAGGRVTSVPLEVYVARVLAGEAEPDAPDASLQALAVAIRTFAIVNAGRHARDGFDLCDGTHCQVPRAATPATRRAARATAGEVMTWKGDPAEVFYSASCGGRSESAASVWPRANLPYLRSVEDDVHDDDEEWQFELTLADIERALDRAGFQGRLRGVSIGSRSESGRVARVSLDGLRPDAMGGDAFRAAIGARDLRSTAFSVSRRGDVVRFTGRGYGHGVGMCVIGAGRRARRGESVERILRQYYPGLERTPLTATRAAARPAPAPPATTPVTTITARVPAGSSLTVSALEELALAAHRSLSQTLGVPGRPLTVDLHGSLDTFRNATGRPWWVSAAVDGSTIALAPAPLLAQRDGIEATLRAAVAEALLAPGLTGRPAWVRVGGARYFARMTGRDAAAARTTSRLRCPSDAELRLAASITAQRDADARAEACFARALSRTQDWRGVR